MDEMRQLVRILVKLMPRFLPKLPSGEPGGGNRLSEPQIKEFLAEVLGDAPHPTWGLPEGWSTYVAGERTRAA